MRKRNMKLRSATAPVQITSVRKASSFELDERAHRQSRARMQIVVLAATLAALTAAKAIGLLP